jgi:hypothetical protein
MVLENGTVMQDWLFYDAAWGPIGPRETIAALPIAYAEAAHADPTSRRRYTFFPSSTNTAASRTFQPRNLLLNPLYNDTSEIKANGVLTLTLPDIDLFGPDESDKVLLTAWCLSRDVSSTNTVRLEYSLNDGGSWTTWATFTAYAAKSTLSVPVQFRRVMLRIGLSHVTDSAATPNGFPILIEGYADWRPLRQWTVVFDPADSFMASYPSGPDQLFSTLQTQQLNSGPVQTLQIGTSTYKAAWKSMLASVRPGTIYETPAPADQAGGHQLFFQEVAQ